MTFLPAFLVGLVGEVAVILTVVNFEYEPLLGPLNLGVRLQNLEMGFTRAISAAIFAASFAASSV